MSKNRSKRRSSALFVARKYIVSAFVIFSFAAYAIHERFVSTDVPLTASAPQGDTSQTQLVVRSIPAPPATATPLLMMQQLQPTVVPSNTPVPTATKSGQYADGQYVGPVTDAWYGYVQIKAVVQGGRITDVQFLQYPNDRRTSQQINSIAMPYLTQEAVQAQSARVNLISGATLTSRAFVQSLASALQSAS